MATESKRQKLEEASESKNTLIESISQKLNLHTTYPTQVAIKSVRVEEISSINPVQNANFVSFHVKSHGEELILPDECFIKIEFKVVDKSDNSALPPNVDLCLVRSIISAMMKNLLLKLNSKVVQSSDGLHGFRADLEKMILNTLEARKNFDLGEFYEEEEGKFENIPVVLSGNPPTEPTTIGGKEIVKRRNKIVGGKTLYVYDKIHADLFMQERPFPPNTDFDLTYDIQDNSDFYFLSKTPGNSQKFKIQIERASIFVTYLGVDLNIINEMYSITVDERLHYHLPFRRIEMNYFNKPQNLSDLSEPNTIVKEGNVLPRRIFVVLVKQSAFQGNITQDPFNYVNLNPTTVALRLNGQLKPYPEIKANRNNDADDVKEPLMFFRKACGVNMSKYLDLGITQKRYKEGGCFIIGFDLTSGDSEDAFELLQRQTVELTYTLMSPTTEPHVMIVMTEYDAELQIDENRNVLKRDFAT